MQIPQLELRPYLERIWARKWWIVIPLVLSLGGGFGYVSGAPRQYRASTLILVEAQRVPDAYVEQTVTQSLQSRLETITQQVKSRTNLEEIIERFGLFATDQKPRNKLLQFKDRLVGKFQELTGLSLGLDNPDQAAGDVALLDQVAAVRRKINISLKSNNMAFEISFVWNDPQLAAQVANALTSQYIEENLKVREQMAMGTTAFLDTEVDRLRQKLETKEQALQRFKTRHMGRLPSQLESNLNIMDQLKDELNNLEQRVDQEKQQLYVLKNQPAAIQSISEQGPSRPSSLEMLQARLEELQAKYTDRHPDVRALKNKIEGLKDQGDQASAREQPGHREPARVESLEVQTQRALIRQRIAQYEQDIAAVKAQLDTYTERVEQTSKVELQLKDLQRGYEAVHSRYLDLLNKKLNAQMAEELEKRQKGEQFRVVDSAVPPKSPVSPDVPKTLLMSLVLGFGLGGGLAYARECLNPVFYTPEELETALETKVLLGLPFAQKNGADPKPGFLRRIVGKAK